MYEITKEGEVIPIQKSYKRRLRLDKREAKLYVEYIWKKA